MFPLPKNIFLLLLKDSMCQLAGEPLFTFLPLSEIHDRLICATGCHGPLGLTLERQRLVKGEGGRLQTLSWLLPAALLVCGDALVQRCSNRYVPGIEASLCSRKVLLCL